MGDSTPLCVDLDGTLVRTNTLVEQLLAVARHRPAALAGLLFSLCRGKAHFKARVSECADLNVSALPYDQRLVEYLKEQKKSGRRLILATAANEKIARAVAGHLGLFEDVIASSGGRNLRGAAKAEALRARFDIGGFCYAGNDRTDLPVWRAARSAVVVNAPRHLPARVAAIARIEREFARKVSPWSALWQAMRPYQWIKNGLVFVPIVTAGAFTDVDSWISAAFTFAAFCAAASSIYIINDLLDVEADRRHLRKRSRPFASGELPLGAGLAAALLLLAAGLSVAFYAGEELFILGYVVVSLAYSIKLKELPLVDIFALSLLYTIRLLAGGEATGHYISLWLLAFSGFFFFSLATIKRVAELRTTEPDPTRYLLPRRGYRPGDLPVLEAMGIGSSFVSALVLTLYVRDNTLVDSRYPEVLWGIVPVTLFWQCRLWLSTVRGFMDDDPIVYSAKDWVTYAVTLIVILLLALHTLVRT